MSDASLYYETHGEGPALAFVHGASGNHLSWWQQVPYFKKHYRCVTFDQRGFGRSTNRFRGRPIPLYAGDLAALLDHLGIAECCVVAQSLGGFAAFELAVAQPERIRALVMADTILGIPSKAIAESLDRLISEGRAGRRNDNFHSAFETREPARAFLYEQIRALNDRPAAVTNLFGPSTVDADLSRFNVPTLFLFGDEDPEQPPELGRYAQQLIPGARYTEVEGAGHSLFWEKPEEFNRIVDDFLTAVGVSRATATATS